MEETEDTQRLTLATKLVLVRSRLGAIPKNGYNSYDKYYYTREEDITHALRPLLDEYNLLILPEITSQEIRELDKGGSAKPSYLTIIKTRYTIIDGDSGERFFLLGEGQGVDDRASDKGLYKAITGAFKYFLKKLFEISDIVDEPEFDGSSSQPGDVDKLKSEAINILSKPQTSQQKKSSRKERSFFNADKDQPSNRDSTQDSSPPQKDNKMGDVISTSENGPSVNAQKEKDENRHAELLERMRNLGSEIYGDKWPSTLPQVIAKTSNGAARHESELSISELSTVVNVFLQYKKKKQQNDNRQDERSIPKDFPSNESAAKFQWMN